MDLKSFSALNRVEKEFDVLEGLKVKMHTLSVLQQQQALAELPTSPVGMDTALRAVILQQALLIYAIDEINSEKIDAQKVKEFIQNLQAPVFNALYNCYDQLAQTQYEVLEELKKKVS